MNPIKTSYKIQDNQVIFSSGKIVPFPYPIAETLDWVDAIIVLLSIPKGQKMNENVFGISYKGEILWQVPETKYLDEISPYTGIERIGTNVGLYNWDATERIVEPVTGRIIEQRFVK